MIKIPTEKIIEKIKEKTGLSDKDIKIKIKDKLDLLSGLISEEGAAHIIANELGVKIFEEAGKLQIKNILGGMRNVEIDAKVIKVYDIKNFDKNNRKGKLGTFLIGDETGIIRVVAWNDKAEILEKLKPGDIIKIENGYSRENNGKAELHLGDKTKIIVSEGNSSDIEVKKAGERKKIKDLNEKDDNVEILGTIVQVFDPKFFEVCPECNKRIKEKEGGFFCDQHDKVTPSFSYVLNLSLDDGSENIRVVLWKTQVQKLLNMSNEEIIGKKDGSFEDIKNDLLGKIVKFIGRTNKNQMFERLEFTPQLVFMDPNPEEEIERLNKEIESIKEQPEKEEQEFSKLEEIKENEIEGKENNKEEDIVEEIDLNNLGKKENLNDRKKEKASKDELLEEIDDLGDLDNL